MKITWPFTRKTVKATLPQKGPVGVARLLRGSADRDRARRSGHVMFVFSYSASEFPALNLDEPWSFVSNAPVVRPCA